MIATIRKCRCKARRHVFASTLHSVLSIYLLNIERLMCLEKVIELWLNCHSDTKIV
jgi:hypothetical protein